MKLLVIGASGLVGSAVYKYPQKLYNVFGTYFTQKRDNLLHLDITNKQEVNELLNKIKPDIIVHSAALPAVDYCEEHQKESWNINVEGTKNIVNVGKNINSKIVFISTDYIFDGKNGPYSEEDIPNPISFYGNIKLECENIVKEYKNYLIIRTTGIYGFETAGKNFVLSLIKNNKAGNIAKIPVDQYSNPTLSDNIADAIIKLCQKNIIGIYNVGSSEFINRYEFALKISRIFNLNQKLITPITTTELKQKAQRPLLSGLKTDKIKNNINIKLFSCYEGLNILKKQLSLPRKQYIGY